MHVLAILAISKAIQFIYIQLFVHIMFRAFTMYNVFLFNWTIEVLFVGKLNHCLSPLG